MSDTPVVSGPEASGPEASDTPGQPDDRRETAAERLDRNWDSLLQELRVTQTGTQILGGFLLAVAFQPRFTELDDFQVAVYLALVCAAAVTTAVGLGPVSLHRILFRQHAMERIVSIGSVLVRLTLAGVAIVLTGTILLIFDVVVGREAGLIAGSAVFGLTCLIWWVVPRLVRPDRP